MRKKTMIGMPKGSGGRGSRSEDSNYDNAFKNKDNEWVEYKFNDKTIQKLEELEKNEPVQLKLIREAYENFVYGYLYHYDMVIRNGADPHTVYFKWMDKHAGIRIAILPEPKQANSPYEKVQIAITNFDPQVAYHVDNDGWLSPRSGGIDPTPPPPPPPPDSLS